MKIRYMGLGKQSIIKDAVTEIDLVKYDAVFYNFIYKI